MALSGFRLIFCLLSVDCAGGAKGPSYSHLTVDSDWEHHRRLTASGPNHFHIVEGIFMSKPLQGNQCFTD